ncbi:unnamed protein product [Calypogeia fissa]
MARKLISTMGLPDSTMSMFASHNLLSANDVLCKTELDLMELLDVPLSELTPALDRVQECACPSHSSVLSLWEERQNKEKGGSYLATKFQELDEALDGGIPFGLITELVGAPGVGKTQLCLMLSVMAAIPTEDGLNRSVIYIDTEHTFSSRRMMEIAQTQFPELSGKTGVMQQLAEHVLVLHPSSLSDLMKSLQGLEVMLIEHSASLVIIDSIAALLSVDSGSENSIQSQEMLGKQASLLKFLAESLRIPVVVTNQVRTKGIEDESGQIPTGIQHDVSFFGEYEDPADEVMEDGLTAALGTKWAHFVNIRLLLEFSASGGRQIKIVKSPMSAFAIVPFCVTSKGLEPQAEEGNEFNASI